MSAVAVQLEESALAWLDVCALDDILPDTGVAALVDGRQIALVRVGRRRRAPRSTPSTTSTPSATPS